jgi:hypothetical protein
MKIQLLISFLLERFLYFCQNIKIFSSTSVPVVDEGHGAGSTFRFFAESGSEKS